MINRELIDPKSIVVVGGSNNVHKPGGRIVRNLLDGNYQGELCVVNAKEGEVQGLKSYHSVKDIPNRELAIISIPGKSCPEVMEILAREKGVKAFIVIAAGFGEESREGSVLERCMLDIVNAAGASLIGPNCIGLMNVNYHGVFTLPVPEFHSDGADFISSSGGTALFIMESALAKGLCFSSVWSVGNSTQIGVEDIVEYMDLHFDPQKDSKIKMLYIEQIKQPQKLLYHASSLIRKGCRIAAIKVGSTESGKRAASSHTGAIASSDSAVDALFRKAGIVRCYGREDLATVASIFSIKETQGKNCAIITQAGGPAVMLTDVLSKGRVNIPKLEGPLVEELKSKLYAGAAVGNPIDIIGTGRAEHLAIAIDYCEKYFDNIDFMIVIFGSAGLMQLFDTYQVLHQKMKECSKPIFPVLPSIMTASEEVQDFIKKGHVNFSDEATLGNALSRVLNTPKPTEEELVPEIDESSIREFIQQIPSSGYLSPEQVGALLRLAHVPLVKECVSSEKEKLLAFAREVGYPVVAKVVGPVHKSDINGVSLDIKDSERLSREYDRMISLQGVTAIMVQPMLRGTELFFGAKYEERFGHVLFCGLGGIFVEALKDVACGLSPLSHEEVRAMIQSLRGYPIMKGIRGKKGIDVRQYEDIIVRLSAMLRYAKEIKEMDINPIVATDEGLFAVDARIRIEK